MMMSITGSLSEAPNSLVLMKNEPTDAELAEQYRRELRDVLEPVRALMDKALAHGLVLQFNLGRTPPNPRHEITNVQVIKYL